MSFKNKLFSVLTLAVAMVAFSVFTFAQDDKTTTTTTPTDKVDHAGKRGDREFGKRKGGREGFEGRRGGFGMMGGLRGINLTDAQKAQIKSIHEANKPDPSVMTEMRNIMQAKRDGTITADQQARLKALRKQGFVKGKSVHDQILGVLTAEQKAQIEQRKQEMKQRFEKRRQERLEKKTITTTDKPITN